jgi:membrane carboxypeptidase/penicillin-binding protein
MIDLAAFYAAIANEGLRPQPHAIDSIEENGRIIYQYPKEQLFPMIATADHASFYQLKTMLQGVVARGTARAISSLSPYVAGKTGTTELAIDGWFVGFTNDVTIAVWVGYDNDGGKGRSLGSSETGAQVALPIFEPIIQAIWRERIAPKAPLSGPSPDARSHLVDLPIDYASGDRTRSKHAYIEHFRRGENGKVEDTQYQLISRHSPPEPRVHVAKRAAPPHDQAGSSRRNVQGDGGQWQWGWGNFRWPQPMERWSEHYY